MNEIWRNIDGFENLYQVSNLGRVKSIEKIDSLGHKRKEKILKPITIKGGYLRVVLYKNNKTHRYLIHRLVASAFISNPNNLPEINHINEINNDNRVDNLEWCSREYNNQYSKNIPVYSINKTTNEIAYYNSLTDAGKVLNINKSSICSCLKGKLKSSGGRYWYYAS